MKPEAAASSRRPIANDPALLVFLIGASVLFGLVSAGIPLALLGWFQPYLVLPAAGVSAVLFAWATVAHLPGEAEAAGGWAVGFIVLLLIGVFVLFAGKYSSEHVLTNRDPGIHVNASWWLAREGNLVIDTGLSADELEKLGPLVDWKSQGIHRAEAGNAYFQGVHGLPVVMAVGRWVGGDWLMFKIPALLAGLGALAVYLLARSIAGYRWALAALIVLLANPISMYAAKDAYTEWLLATFAIGGLYLWVRTADGGGWIGGLVAGLFLGLGASARIDAWVVFIGFVLGLAWFGFARSHRPRERQFLDVAAPIAGVAIGGAIGLADLVFRSPRYLADLWANALPMFVGFGVAVAVALVAAWLGARRAPGIAAQTRWRRIAAATSGAAAVLVWAGLLWLRPLVQTAHREFENSLVAGLQAREGLAVDGSQTYAEMSAQWLTWYQGWPFVLAVAGLTGVVASWLVLGRASKLRPVATAAWVVAALYLIRPAITPDHLWAMRRFLPVVIPLFVVVVVWGLRLVMSWLDGVPRQLVAAAGVLVLISAAGVGLVVGWPTAAVDTQVGMLGATRRMCAAFPDDAVAYVDPTTHLAATVHAVLRSYCDIPVVQFVGRNEPGGLEAAQSIAAQFGRELILVEADTIQSSGVEIHHESLTYSFPRRVLRGPPRAAETERFAARLVASNSSSR